MINLRNIKFNNLNLQAPLAVVPPTPPSVPNKALYFDGIDEYVYTDHNAPLTITGNVTIAAWAKITSAPTGQYPNIAGKNADNAGYMLFVLPEYGPINVVAFAINNTGPIVEIPDYTSWHHYVGVFDGTNAILYLDGLEVSRAASASPASNTNSFIIGRHYGNNRADYINGSIDEVAVWSKALSDNDVADLYNSGNGLCVNHLNNFPTDGGSMGTDLKGLWHFNQTSGLTATDSSGYGNNGTLTNMDDTNWVDGKVQCTSEPTPPIPPQPNKALSFDGSDEYVKATGYYGVGGATARSISAWIKATSIEAYRNIVCWGDLTGTGNLFQFMIMPTSVGDGLCIHVSGKINYTVDSVATGDWVHVAVTSDGGVCTMFINGAVATLTYGDITFLNTALTQEVHIGVRPSDGGDLFNGQIDEVAIWSKVLSNNDIADLYNSGNGLCINPANNFPTDGGPIGTNLELLYHLNQTSGIVATDSSGNSRTGDLTNMDDTNWVDGKVQCT